MKHNCPYCGHTLEPRKESLSLGLVQTLEKFALAVFMSQKNDIHLQKDMNLTKNQYNNAQKLRYFGLIAKVRVAGQVNSGRWLLTRRGASFLRGEPIHKWVKVYNNHLVARSAEKVTIKDMLDHDVYWNEKLDYLIPKTEGNQTMLI
jgi:hypothetical protein